MSRQHRLEHLAVVDVGDEARDTGLEALIGRGRVAPCSRAGEADRLLVRARPDEPRLDVAQPLVGARVVERREGRASGRGGRTR